MRYIFLDVDGVLNHAATKARINGYRSVDHANVETLKLMTDLFGMEFGKENIKLVLSSSWRYNQDLDGNFLADNEFRKELDRVLSEFDLRIDDETPILSAVERGKEIACYLSDKAAACEGYLSWMMLLFRIFQSIRSHVILFRPPSRIRAWNSGILIGPWLQWRSLLLRMRSGSLDPWPPVHFLWTGREGFSRLIFTYLQHLILPKGSFT